MNSSSQTQASSEEQQKQGVVSNNHEKLSSVISISESESKKQLSPTPEMLENISSPNTNKALEAMPLSYVSPHEKVGILTSSSNKARQSKKVEWEKNWYCQPRKRSDGKYDKYYYLKEPPYTMCRSLVAVAKFESVRAQEAAEKLSPNKNGKLSSNKKRSYKCLGEEIGESSTERRCGSLVGSEHEKFVTESLADAWDRLMHAGDRYEKTSKDKEAQSKHTKQEFSIEHESGDRSSGDGDKVDEANATQPWNLNDLRDMMAQQYAALSARMDGLEALLKEMMEFLRQKKDQ